MRIAQSILIMETVGKQLIKVASYLDIAVRCLQPHERAWRSMPCQSSSGRRSIGLWPDTPRKGYPCFMQEKPRFVKLTELDAVRGIAAAIVFSGHFCEGLLPAVTSALNGTPLFIALNGPAAVIVFFVLSGFVLTLRPLSAQRAGLIIPLALKRWPRLAGPVAVAALGYSLAAMIGAFPAPRSTRRQTAGAPTGLPVLGPGAAQRRCLRRYGRGNLADISAGTRATQRRTLDHALGIHRRLPGVQPCGRQPAEMAPCRPRRPVRDAMGHGSVVQSMADRLSIRRLWCRAALQVR